VRLGIVGCHITIESETPMTSVIEAEGLTKRSGATQALAGVDIAADRGQVLAPLGPNGAGKTTIVRVLSTLLRADSGQARTCTTCWPTPCRCASSSPSPASTRRWTTS